MPRLSQIRTVATPPAASELKDLTRRIQTASGFEDHAILWTGTAQSFVDINPVDHGSSSALAVSGDQIAGVSAPPGANSHAAIWSISAHAFTDLTPSPASGPDNFQAAALDTNGFQQVGWIQDLAGIRAQLWSGSAQSAVNLHALLPGTFTNSWATSIDVQGNIYGIATDSDNSVHAIEWAQSAVPEPASAGILLTLAPLTLLRRRRVRKQS